MFRFGSLKYASVVEWSITLGCKPSGFGLRRFESYPAHQLIKNSGICRSFLLCCLLVCFRLYFYFRSWRRRSCRCCFWSWHVVFSGVFHRMFVKLLLAKYTDNLDKNNLKLFYATLIAICLTTFFDIYPTSVILVADVTPNER